MDETSAEPLPSAGWAVEITGERFDLDDLREMLRKPFDPWVEDYHLQGTIRLLLRSNSWATVADSSVVLEDARRLVTRINGAKLVLQSDSLPVSLGELFNFRSDGTRLPILIAATGHFKLSGFRMRGRATIASAEPPPPPTQSPLQNWLHGADTNNNHADLLEHLARADNWYDVYKSAEIIRRIAKRGGGIRALLEPTQSSQWDRVWQMANCMRHAPDPVKYPLPAIPPTIEEARTLLFLAARVVL